MRCDCCNVKLSDYETTLKHAETGEYLNTCLDCLAEIANDVPIPVQARKDLVPQWDIDDYLDRDTDPCYTMNYRDEQQRLSDDH